MQPFTGFHKKKQLFSYFSLSRPLHMLSISEKHPELQDEALLALFQDKGDLDVLGELYTRYMHLVLGVALKYLGNREDARDAVMQIFEKLITDLPDQEIRTFKSWLYVLTKNHCLMEIRSRKSRDNKADDLKIEMKFMESRDEVHPIDEDGFSMEDALKACIEKLKEEQKQCIRLFYYEKLCYREISAKLALEEKKVKSLLQNGKRNLKICLEGNHVR